MHLGLAFCHDFMTGRVWRYCLAFNENLDATRTWIHTCITHNGALGRLSGDISTPGTELDVGYIIDNCSGHFRGLPALNYFVPCNLGDESMQITIAPLTKFTG